MQNKFVRLVNNKDHLITPPLFHELFKLFLIFANFKLENYLNYLNSIGPSKQVIKLKVFEMHNYNTRYAMKGNIYKNCARTTRFDLTCLKNMGSKIWGSIPKKGL